MSATPDQTKPAAWPTLGGLFASWNATCNRCGEKLPPDTRINAAWSPTRFAVSCQCSPRQWISMEVSAA